MCNWFRRSKPDLASMTLVAKSKPEPWVGEFSALYQDARGNYFALHDNTRLPRPRIHAVTKEAAERFIALVKQSEDLQAAARNSPPIGDMFRDAQRRQQEAQQQQAAAVIAALQNLTDEISEELLESMVGTLGRRNVERIRLLRNEARTAIASAATLHPSTSHHQL